MTTPVAGAITVEVRDGRNWAVLRGEVDHTVVTPDHESLVKDCWSEGPVFVDMSGVTFLDSAGLAFLVTVYNHVGEVHLAGVSRSAAKLLRISGLDDLFVVG